MASTFRPADAFDFVKKFVKDMPLETVGAQILDDVSKMMWMAAPWRWTLGSFSAGPMVVATKDYAVTFPGDFLYIEQATLTDGATINDDLEVESTLPALTLPGQPKRVAPTATGVRVFPVPGTQQTTQTILCRYKKTAPSITRQTMYTAGTQVFDDEWFWVFREGVLWKALAYADDNRAGGVQVQPGSIAFTGQRAVFEAGLEFMRASEGLPLRWPKQEPKKDRG